MEMNSHFWHKMDSLEDVVLQRRKEPRRRSHSMATVTTVARKATRKLTVGRRVRTPERSQHGTPSSRRRENKATLHWMVVLSTYYVV